MDCCKQKNKEDLSNEVPAKKGNLSYSVLLIGFVVLVWVSYSAFFSSGPNTVIENNDQNFNYYEQKAQLSNSECGDLNDPSNIQHLSHHPDKYQECLKQIDPQKFKEAVGQDITSFLR
ncbi:MAG TPA: hypothetical protein VI912_05445 [Candidatus Bilamarchaeaceae archaeon]|nr:hypothetical protein [Candidatus Bilamarchaeaceae archaeon]